MMKLKQILASLTAAALTCCMAAAFTGVQAEDTSEKLRVMPLGDSITDGFTVTGGYRTSLWKTLEANGYTDGIDFVGPNWGGDGIDPNHAGYSGYAIADIPGQRQGIYNFIDYLMENYPADVVMLQIGTNDILSSCTDGMGDRLELLVDSILTYIPEDGLLYVATIPYMDADVTNYTDAYTVEEMDAAVDAYNADVKALVARKQSEGKQIALSDINSVLTKADLGDGVHPSQEGYDKMGAYWYEKLTAYIDGSAGTVPTEPTTELTEASTETTEETTTESTEASTEPTTDEFIYDASGTLLLASTPDKLQYSLGFVPEDLDLTGLKVSLYYSYHRIDEFGEEYGYEVVYNEVSPLEHPEAFIVDTSAVGTGLGKHTITIRVTDEMKERYNVTTDAVSFEIQVYDIIDIPFIDLNHDMSMNLLDVILLQKYLLGVETLDSTAYYTADINSDGEVDVFDLAYLKKIILQFR